MARAAGLRTRMAVLLAASLCACYRYAPISLANLRPHEDVRLSVTEPAAARLVKELGTYTTELEGEVVREGADSVSVAVIIARDYRGTALESARLVLFLGRSEVVELRRRELSRARTVLASAGVAVLFGVLVRSIVAAADPNPDSRETLPPPPPSGYRARMRLSIP